MPADRDFEIIAEIRHIETFARGVGVRDRNRLNHRYAGGRRVRWLKRKGFTTVRYSNGEIWEAEAHWYDGHGVGRVEEKVTHRIRRLG